jgi:phosphohistidine swiveling domain-containing protein
MIERCHHEHAVAEAGWRRLAAIDWVSADRATMADGIAAYVESCAVFSAFICWPVLAEIELERRLHARLEATFGDDAAAAFEVATDPVRPGSVLEERLELLAIASELAAGRPIDAALARHTERHGWMKNVGYVGELHTAEHYLREATAMAALAPEVLARGLRKEQADKAHRLADLIERAGPGSELATLITIANDLVYFRSYRAEIFYRSFVDVQRLLAAGAAAVGVSPQDMLYLLPDELIGALRAGELAPLDRIADRRRGYLYLNDAVLGPIIHGGQEAMRRCPSIDEGGDPSAGDELRGQAAFAGRIRGRVAVVRSLSELELVRPGDVLVTHATNIDYVSTLHRVAAIVTEEGGILCHAAVVSRELRIPAVMGTGNATKILHTGDLVEVDAVAGVVRRLAQTP